MKKKFDASSLGSLTLNDLAFSYNIQIPIWSEKQVFELLTEMLKDIYLGTGPLYFYDSESMPQLSDDGLECAEGGHCYD